MPMPKKYLRDVWSDMKSLVPSYKEEEETQEPIRIPRFSHAPRFFDISSLDLEPPRIPLHSSGFQHLDLKPINIIKDFGLTQFNYQGDSPVSIITHPWRKGESDRFQFPSYWD